MPKDGWYGPAVGDYASVDGGEHTGPVTIGVIHTTESGVGKYRPSGIGTVYGNFGHSSFPHFTVDVQGGICVVFQHISIRKSGRALKNRSGGVQTNREGCVQIEVVGSATRPFTQRSDAHILVPGLVALMRWVESQTEIPPTSSVVWRAYPDSYGDSPVRLSGAQWQSYRGWLGHQHVPENDHGDPGVILVAGLLPAPVKPAVKPALKEKPVVAPPKGPNMQFLVTDTRREDVRPVYITDLLTKRWISTPKQLAEIKATGVVSASLSGETLDTIPTVGRIPVLPAEV